MVRLMI